MQMDKYFVTATEEFASSDFHNENFIMLLEVYSFISYQCSFEVVYSL